MRRLERIEASQPLQYIVEGDYAVATSQRPARGFVPILLHREKGLWRIDLVETWKNLFFDSDGNYFLRNSNTPYAFALKQFGSGRHFDMARVPLRGVSLQRWLEALDRDDDVIASFGERSCGCATASCFRSADRVRARASIGPARSDGARVLGERARYLGFPRSPSGVGTDGRGVEYSLAEAYNEAGDRPGARRWIERALKQDPYDIRGLEWRQYLAEREGNDEEVQRAQEMIAALKTKPRPSSSAGHVVLPSELAAVRARYDPRRQRHQVFDHSKFGVTLQNTSDRPSNRNRDVDQRRQCPAERAG